MIAGRCACGQVRYRIQPPTDFAAHCHCRTCQRVSGAAFLTWTSVPRARFHLDADGALRWWHSSDPIRWGFCGSCGSTLLYEAVTEGHPERPRTTAIYVTAASLDQLDRSPTMHVSFEEHQPWLEPGDGLPRHLGKGDRVLLAQGAHVILFVADQDRSTAFYRAVLDREPRLDVPGMTELVLPGGMVLGLMPEAGIQRLVPVTTPPSTRAELYLRSPDADALYERALRAGATLLSDFAPRSWGETVAYLADPDGHLLAIARYDAAG